MKTGEQKARRKPKPKAKKRKLGSRRKRKIGEPRSRGRKQAGESTAATKARGVAAKPRARIATRPLGDCLELPDAEAVVMGCAGGDYDIDTRLGDLFPSPMRREQFCQCVADDAGVPRPLIPGGGSTTLGAVISAIAC